MTEMVAAAVVFQIWTWEMLGINLLGFFRDFPSVYRQMPVQYLQQDFITSFLISVCLPFMIVTLKQNL
jgi:glycerol uptake facilitator-like aquaporin